MPQAYTFDVFLSYAQRDALLAEQLARSIASTGLRVWFDRWELVPGRSWWQEALSDAIGKSAAALVCIGSPSASAYQRQEVQLILGTAQATERPRAVILVLLPGADERFVPEPLRHLESIDLSEGIDDPEKLAQLLASIRTIPRREGIDQHEDHERDLAASLSKVGDGYLALGQIDNAL